MLLLRNKLKKEAEEEAAQEQAQKEAEEEEAHEKSIIKNQPAKIETEEEAKLKGNRKL